MLERAFSDSPLKVAAWQLLFNNNNMVGIVQRLELLLVVQEIWVRFPVPTQKIIL